MKKLIKIPFSGFYYSIHDESFDHEIEMLMENDNNQFENLQESIDNINWSIVHNEYAKEYANHFKWEIGLSSLQFYKLESPRYYNFETDSILCTISMKDVRHMFNVIKKGGVEDMNLVCNELFTSRDGFISFYETDWACWPSLNEWDCNQLYALLCAYIQHSEYSFGLGRSYNSIELTIYEEMQGNGVIMNCVDKGMQLCEIK